MRPGRFLPLGPVTLFLFHSELANEAEYFQSIDSCFPRDRRVNFKAALPVRERMHADFVLALNDDRFRHRFLPGLPKITKESAERPQRFRSKQANFKLRHALQSAGEQTRVSPVRCSRQPPNGR